MAEKVLGLITARAGSKRLPGKNIKQLGGKPLIEWTIDAAKKSKYISDLVVSSDDLKLLRLCEEKGCSVPFVRPANLSTDYSTSADVVEHALANLKEKYDWLILLQPTSPFRRTEHIDEALEKALHLSVNSLIAIAELPVSHYMNLTIDKNNALKIVSGFPLEKLNSIRSQDMPKTYAINGAIYVVKVDFFLENKVFFNDQSSYYIMQEESSVNIDTHHDWLVAESYLSRYKDLEQNQNLLPEQEL